MEEMNINTSDLSNSAISFFNKNVFSSLTTQQKKITAIVAIVFAFLASCYLVRCYCLKVCVKESAKQEFLLSDDILTLGKRKSSDGFHSENRSNHIIDTYFENFEQLAKTEKWDDIISEGSVALDEARKQKKRGDEAKICAQLTSTSFYQGNYTQALLYANCCHELSQEFLDPTLFVRSLYLESAVHRALAGKKSDEDQKSYFQAVKIAEEAMQVYVNSKLNNENLKGKIYFNLGAAHADNPNGDRQEAVRCYDLALVCFKNAKAIDDCVRTNIRLGKIYLLEKKYDLSQKMIDEVRSQTSNERLTMHTDYLEAQLKLAINDIKNAMKIANIGLNRAKILGAKEDDSRFVSLIKMIKHPI